MARFRLMPDAPYHAQEGGARRPVNLPPGPGTGRSADAPTTAVARKKGARPLDFALTPEQRAIQDLARGVADRYIRPRIQRLDAEERFDREIMEAMGAAGLLGVCLPERYG